MVVLLGISHQGLFFDNPAYAREIVLAPPPAEDTKASHPRKTNPLMAAIIDPRPPLSLLLCRHQLLCLLLVFCRNGTNRAARSGERKVRVCSTCHRAGEDFRKALLSGSEEGAMAAFSTGCVNLRVPYTIYHNEVCLMLYKFGPFVFFEVLKWYLIFGIFFRFFVGRRWHRIFLLCHHTRNWAVKLRLC